MKTTDKSYSVIVGSLPIALIRTNCIMSFMLICKLYVKFKKYTTCQFKCCSDDCCDKYIKIAGLSCNSLSSCSIGSDYSLKTEYCLSGEKNELIMGACSTAYSYLIGHTCEECACYQTPNLLSCMDILLNVLITTREDCVVDVKMNIQY